MPITWFNVRAAGNEPGFTVKVIYDRTLAGVR
ncbi:hypothetical protein SAMN05421505_103275 [Sinosporangium album]|uniref:Uncharacterized protein n=1 Tax=Sinosporangium album TaxID=504805 RepID=A0A1G7THP4_9ACTN|nr:hypothetical protein SAMN05421505_103275 [Sinosporangium album]